MERIYKKIPENIRAILLQSEGWLVGSSLTKIINGEEIKDYDIIVPSRELFQTTILSVYNYSSSAQMNSFGGWKFTINDIELDIWCEELDYFLKKANFVDFIYNFKSNLLLKIQ